MEQSSRRRFAWVASVALVLLLAAAFLYRGIDRPETASGLVPEPVQPFGSVRGEEIVFRWARPSDGAPVRVEVLDAARVLIWRSDPTRKGSLVPGHTLPQGDLYWRPVALSPAGDERPGNLAAFAITY